MKRFFCTVWTAVFLSLLFVPAHAEIEAPEITSKSAVVMDAASGQILFEKAKDEKVYPASITKIVTVYLAAKNCDKSEKVTGSRAAIDSVPKDSSNIALDYGEVLTVEQACAAAMLMSANDAANALGEHVSGSIDEFVKLMNTTAQLFGANATHFANTNGLPDENHYTTAQDFAKITRGMVNDSKEFLRYFGMVNYTIPKTNKKAEPRNFVAKHRMMHMDKYKYLGVAGGKTGYTTQAEHTAVTYAKKDGKEIIVVLFGAKNLGVLYNETRDLLEYAYNGFTPVTVTAEEIGSREVDGKVISPVGKASFYLLNSYTKADLEYKFSDKNVIICDKQGNVLSTLSASVTEDTGAKSGGKILLKIGIGVLIALILFGLWSFKDRSRRKRKVRKMKRRRIMEEEQKETVKR